MAQARKLLPTWMGSAELRQLEQGLRNASVFSARMTHARAVQWLKDAIARRLQGGMGNDKAKLRFELKQLLTRLGYTPEKGFPGDEALGIPPADPGSLRDLSSDVRINLLLDTQEQLMAGASQELRGNDPDRARIFPAWELVRISNRRVPRGSVGSGTKGWPQRFVESGGVITRDGTQEKMIALKSHPVWAALGNSAIFKDALDVSHPPFAFNSGMGWKEVYYRDLPEAFLKQQQPKQKAEPTVAEERVEKVLPPVKAHTGSLDPGLKERLMAGLKASEDRFGVLTMDRILKGEVKL
jgi:hypothetical protein